MDTNFVPSLWPALLIPARGCSGSRAGCKSENNRGKSIVPAPAAVRTANSNRKDHPSLFTNHRNHHGRGATVGRGRGVGKPRGVGVGLAVAVGVGVAVAIAVAVAVGVAVVVDVAVAVDLAYGVDVGIAVGVDV